MGWKWVELLAGAAIAALALLDLFGTVAAPGRVRLGLHPAGAIRRLVLPGWRRAATRRGGEGHSLLSGFAAFLLLSAFVSWVALVNLGFGLIVHALRADFRPAIESFPEALFQTGSAMMTLGLSGRHAEGWARLAVVLAGLSGLQVVTLALTYILQIQTALQQRDAAVIMLSSRAGAPPSGLAVLTVMAELGLQPELADFFLDWERWAAQLLYSHAAHPVLGYFRSPDQDNDWLDSLAAVLDAAALMLSLVEDDGNRGRAELFFRTASRAAGDLCAQYGVHPGEPARPDQGRMAGVRRRLQDAGYRLRPAEVCADALLTRLRAYRGHLDALTAHFGVRPPAWS